MGPHRQVRRVTHGPRGHPGKDLGRDHEPRVVVDARHDLRLRAIRDPHTADDVHLPQLHRPAPLPALVVRPLPAPRARDDRPRDAPDTDRSTCAPATATTPPDRATSESWAGPHRQRLPVVEDLQHRLSALLHPSQLHEHRRPLPNAGAQRRKEKAATANKSTQRVSPVPGPRCQA